MSKSLTPEKETLIRSIDAVLQIAHPGQLRAVAYLRVSTEEQKKGFGIAYTGKRVVKHVAKKGWALTDVFADEGFSGSLEAKDRPDVKELMEQARQVPRPFDVVVVPEERAIGRAGRAFWPWVWELEDLGVATAIVRGNYDNTTDEGRKRMRDEAARAEDERIAIRDRTQGGIQEKAEMGGHPGGVAPYGWKIMGKGEKGKSYLALDVENGHKYLHEAWELIVENGMAPHAVEDAFNRRGLHGPTMPYWPRGSLRHVLTGRAVQEARRVFRDPSSNNGKRGTRLDVEGSPQYGDTVVIKLPPMFTDKQLARLNAALKRTARSDVSEASCHPLSKRIVGACGKHYTGVSRIGRDSDRAYRCSGKNPEKPGSPRCDCAQINAATIEAKIWGEVCKLLGDPARLSAMADDWIGRSEAGHVDYDTRITELQRQIKGYDKAMEAAVLVAAQQEDATTAIQAAVATLAKDRKSAEKLLEEVKAWRDEAEDLARRGRDLQELAEVARVRLHDMGALEQAEVLELLDVRVTILGEIPRKTRKDDQITAWFRDRDRAVPDLTDATWPLVEPIFAARKGRRPKDPRALLADMLLKARTGCSWRGLAYGDVASVWQRWLKSGLWGQLMEALATLPGTPVRDRVLLPPLRVEGRVDPSLFISPDESLDLEESALLEHEAVAEAAVVPAPDPLRLAVPKAYVVLAEGWEPGPETAKVLFAHSRAVLAPYKRVRRLEFAALPKTVSGKIRRIELRERTLRGDGVEFHEETTS